MRNTSQNTVATESVFSFAIKLHVGIEMLKSGCPVSPCSNAVSRIRPEFIIAVQGNTAFCSIPGRSETSPPTRPVRKQVRGNKFQTTNSRNQRKAVARAHKRQEAAEEKCSNSGSRQVSSLTSSRSDCSTSSGAVPAGIPLGGILEDPYVEKARMQEKFARENPEEKLSKILTGNSSKILAGNSPKIPAGNSSTILEERRRRCRSGEMPKIL